MSRFSPLPRSEIEGDFQSDLRMTYCASVVMDITEASFNTVAARDMVLLCRVSATSPPCLTSDMGRSVCLETWGD